MVGTCHSALSTGSNTLKKLQQKLKQIEQNDRTTECQMMTPLGPE